MIVELFAIALALLAGVVVGAWMFDSKREGPHGAQQSVVLRESGAATSSEGPAIDLIVEMLLINEELQDELAATVHKLDLQTLESEDPSSDLGFQTRICSAIEPAFDLSDHCSDIA